MNTNLIWDSVKDVLYISRENFFSGWDIREHKIDGIVVGAALTKESEFHFVTFGNQWALTRRDIRNYLLPILGKYGYVTTKTPIEDVRQHRFNKILGFVANGEDEFYTHYRLANIRGIVCQ